MVSGTTQLVASLTTNMQGDNVTALCRHGYLTGMAAPGNKVRTDITIILCLAELVIIFSVLIQHFHFVLSLHYLFLMVIIV